MAILDKIHVKLCKTVKIEIVNENRVELDCTLPNKFSLCGFNNLYNSNLYGSTFYAVKRVSVHCSVFFPINLVFLPFFIYSLIHFSFCIRHIRVQDFISN